MNALILFLIKKVPIFSFTFGRLSKDCIDKLHSNNTLIIGTATCSAEAEILIEDGIDIICAQGFEAGGHRGNFLNNENTKVGGMALIPQVADFCNNSLIYAGGINDHRGMAAAFSLGASAVQLGTAFLTTNEAGVHNVYKDEIVKSKDISSVLTRSFSGKYARGIANKFIKEFEELKELIPDYPIQNLLTGAIRKKAASIANKDYMSLWCGQNPPNQILSASTVIENIITNYRDLEF